MATKNKSRIAPDIDLSLLTENFADQLSSGHVTDAIASDTVIPPLYSPRGQSVRIDRCVWTSVTLADPKAHGLHLHDGGRVAVESDYRRAEEIATSLIEGGAA